MCWSAAGARLHVHGARLVVLKRVYCLSQGPMPGRCAAWFLPAALALGCADPSGSTGPITGGQSGTDSGGAFRCESENAVPGDAVALDHVDGFDCSPDEVLAFVEGNRELVCDFGASVTVELAGSGTARQLTGVGFRGETSTGRGCPLLAVDVSGRVARVDEAFVASAETLVVTPYCEITLDATTSRTGSEAIGAVRVHFDRERRAAKALLFEQDGTIAARCSAEDLIAR